ncbi:retrograde regulation protein 2, partial [Hortaea werneckii]
ARIEKDRHDAIAEPFTLSHYLRCACDAKVWAFAWLFGLTTTVSYAIAYFLPIILNDGMGFSVAASQCLISPPYVAAAIWMYACAYFGDKYRLRAPFIVFNAIVGIVGLALLGFTENNGARYFGVFLATISANSNIPCILTYQANNIRGQWKRALASATLVGAGGIGGIVGTTVFRQEDKPEYRPGMYATILASCLVVVISLLLSLKFHRANKRAAAGGKIIEGLEGFRYTL